MASSDSEWNVKLQASDALLDALATEVIKFGRIWNEQSTLLIAKNAEIMVSSYYLAYMMWSIPDWAKTLMTGQTLRSLWTR